MSNYEERIKRLQSELVKLTEDQARFQVRIAEMRAELNFLKTNAPPQETVKPQTEFTGAQQTQPEIEFKQTPPPFQSEERFEKERPQSSAKYEPIFNREPKPKVEAGEQSGLNIEKFIGENLISKIGIVILIIGVAIGGKYGYDNNWITPLMVVVFFYGLGLSLVGLAVKLKPKYLNFSAVLLSGGMAIMYFITYFAYSFYGLINQPSAFVLMVIFTVFTVASATVYDKQIIAHIGLVGAYFVPFMLSDGSGNFAILFTYIAIINVGILVLSVVKYWKPLFYTSYLATWLIFSAFYFGQYSYDRHFTLALFFLFFYFITFYITFIVYKVVSKENLAVENVGLVLANSFIFYGFAYSILSRAGFENMLGLFTVGNAAVHLYFAYVISRLNLASRDLIYLTTILVFTFVTIAVPVQFDGNFVTLIWSAEAAGLFWIGRGKQIALFENYAYPLMALASASLLGVWFDNLNFASDAANSVYPILNPDFAVGIFFIIAFGSIVYLNSKRKAGSSLPEDLGKLVGFLIPAIFIFALYNVFRIEIGNYFAYRANYRPAPEMAEGNLARTFEDYFFYFNILWQINYTMMFLMICGFLNIRRFKNSAFGFINLFANSFAIFIYVTFGMYVLDALRSEFFDQSTVDNSPHGIFNILIRYVCLGFFAALCYSTYRYVKEEFLTDYIPGKVLITLFDLGFYFSILIILSVELVTWLDVFEFTESFKLGLSILWGIYAVFLIVLGIALRKLHLRVFAIVLFAATLLKLFFYDIAELDTIRKTIVFVSLGILLLIISFLYTKFKNVIFEEVSDPSAAADG